MISKKQKIDLILKEVDNQLFKNKLITKVSLKELFPEIICYKTNSGNIFYGYDSDIDYFAIYVDSNYEGFLWTRSSYKENGVYRTYDRIKTTEKYNFIENILRDHFSLDILRDIQLDFIRENFENMDYTFDRLITRITFSNTSRIKKNNKFKILTCVLITLIEDYDKEFSKELSEKSQELLYFMRTIRNTYEYNVNNIISILVAENIDYIMKNKININSIYRYIESLGE